MVEYAIKRRHRRYDPTEVQRAIAESVDATVENISILGMAVLSGTPLTAGNKYTFHIQQQDEDLYVTGAVKWCHPVDPAGGGDAESSYRAGLAFDEMLSARELMQIARTSVAVDLPERIYGRFTVADEDPVHLLADYSFLVKELSASRVLIRGTARLDPETIMGIEIRLDDDFFRSQARITDVREMDAADGSAVFQTGLELVEIEADQRKLLETFVREQLEAES